jgi:NAD(P)-dependent dehydrogenase (short-subunit alcohol dehydrogenase family)
MTEISTRARYGQSKLANIFFTQELAKRYPSIRSVAVHPGAVNTNLVQGLQKSHPWVPGRVWPFLMGIFTAPVTQGALNQLWASCSAEAKSGEFYDPVGKIGRVSEHAKDEKMAETLWSWTEEQLGKRGF